MSVAPAHRTRDSDSTFAPDIGAELEQVVFLPHLVLLNARARHERAVAGAIASLNLDAWKGQKEKTDSCRKRQLNTI